MQRIDRTGEYNKNTIGLGMTIHTYRHANDIDIRFDDGTVVKHKRYNHFKTGSILHPDQNRSDFITKSVKNKCKSYKNQYQNTKAQMNCGETCRIIDYKSSKQITVQFLRTKSIVKTSLKRFRERTIQDPKSDLTQIKNNRESRTGETKTASCGMNMMITEYNSQDDITVRFEDGTTIKHRYNDFLNNRIPHPLYPTVNRSMYSSPKTIDYIERRQVAYNCGIPNYYCTCTKCMTSDIWNWQEIKEHNELHEQEKKL